MARRTTSTASLTEESVQAGNRTATEASGAKTANGARKTWSDLFSHLASTTAHWAGKPTVFLIAVAVVVIWAATGPLFGYSDTWQLVINTSTTIVTFLMVFLIQNTQNRDTLALQLKLSEIILVLRDAENKLAVAEDMSEEELEQLHEELRRRAEETLGTLNSRREQRAKKQAS